MKIWNLMMTAFLLLHAVTARNYISSQVNLSSWTPKQPTRSYVCPTTAWPWRRTRARWRRATPRSASAEQAPMELLVMSLLTAGVTIGRCYSEHPHGKNHTHAHTSALYKPARRLDKLKYLSFGSLNLGCYATSPPTHHTHTQQTHTTHSVYSYSNYILFTNWLWSRPFSCTKNPKGLRVSCVSSAWGSLTV